MSYELRKNDHEVAVKVTLKEADFSFKTSNPDENY